MHWIPFPDERLIVSGLPFWAETRPELQRLPNRVRGSIHEPVFAQALAPAGARIRFSSDTGSLAVRLRYPETPKGRGVIPAGQAGVDLYVNDRYWATTVPGEKPEIEDPLVSGATRRLRDFVLYLPLTAPLSLTAIGLDDGARIEPPRPFAASSPIVCFGGEVTAGGSASRTGLAFPAILGRELNLDIVNFGFRGAGRPDREFAGLLGEVEAHSYLLDLGRDEQDPERIRDGLPAFLLALREVRPDTPIFCMTPIFDSVEHYQEEARERLELRRQMIRNTVTLQRMNGDAHLVLIEGHDLLGPKDDEGLVDGTSPNDLGCKSIAVSLKAAMRRSLRPRPVPPPSRAVNQRPVHASR